MKEFLILVDDTDKAWGKIEKQEAHELGLLHRAFSIFIFNSKNQLLLQQRADSKYHSPGKWTNTCCSHPRYGEETLEAADRRLREEMGMKCKLDFQFSFTYKSTFENGLIEHEYDHVYFGNCDTTPDPEPSEVKNWKYVDLNFLQNDIKTNPHLYSEWLKICFDQVYQYSKAV
ncbi:MAG: isopentenyl-diphosphate Delta-isomerase [Bacteroidia bacterium]|nr:isopentenyl-diphosphate Delta-isomerase [Bacteroidia bacterium]